MAYALSRSLGGSPRSKPANHSASLVIDSQAHRREELNRSGKQIQSLRFFKRITPWAYGRRYAHSNRVFSTRHALSYLRSCSGAATSHVRIKTRPFLTTPHYFLASSCSQAASSQSPEFTHRIPISVELNFPSIPLMMCAGRRPRVFDCGRSCWP